MNNLKYFFVPKKNLVYNFNKIVKLYLTATNFGILKINTT